MSRARLEIGESHTLAVSVWNLIKKNLAPSPTFRFSIANSDSTVYYVSPDVMHWRSHSICRMYSGPKMFNRNTSKPNLHFIGNTGDKETM